MDILSDQHLADYRSQLTVDIGSALKQLAAVSLTPQSFTFYTSVAVMSSAKIEGEPLEVDSYVKYKMQQVEYLPELVRKPDDLFQAYIFAEKNELNQANLLHSHRLLAQHLLPEKWRGIYRTSQMLVMEHNTGKIQFEAAPASLVSAEMDKLWRDIAALRQSSLSETEVFYYAAYLHLTFVCIHPFNDGNGRAARLLEKWFLADRLGAVGWYVPSERHYYQHVNEYYRNLNRVGVFYDQLDYARADWFLQMLPNAV